MLSASLQHLTPTPSKPEERGRWNTILRYNCSKVRLSPFQLTHTAQTLLSIPPYLRSALKNFLPGSGMQVPGGHYWLCSLLTGLPAVSSWPGQAESAHSRLTAQYCHRPLLPAPLPPEPRGLETQGRPGCCGKDSRGQLIISSLWTRARPCPCLPTASSVLCGEGWGHPLVLRLGKSKGGRPSGPANPSPDLCSLFPSTHVHTHAMQTRGWP